MCGWGEKSPLNMIQVDGERIRLEREIDRVTEEEGGDSENLQYLYDRLDSLDAVTAPKRAGELLHGLGMAVHQIVTGLVDS